MLFRIKSMLVMTTLAAAELLFSQYATADMVTFRATGEITSVSLANGFSHPIQIGDTWEFTYSFLSDEAPGAATLPKGWDNGAYAEYWSDSGWTLTVAGNTFDDATENVGRASTGVQVMNDAKYNHIPGEADHIDDRYNILGGDVIGTGAFLQLMLAASTPVGSTPHLVNSTDFTGFDLSAASEKSFSYRNQEFSLRGNVSSIEEISPVPLPAAAVLFLSSLFGLGGLQVFRKKEAC